VKLGKYHKVSVIWIRFSQSFKNTAPQSRLDDSLLDGEEIGMFNVNKLHRQKQC
jgi:hypothetical protein